MEEEKTITKAAEIDSDYILNYVEEKGMSEIEWLNNLLDNANLTHKSGNKAGQPRQMTFIEIRQEFIKRHLPHLLSTPKPHTPNMYDRIRALRQKAQEQEQGQTRQAGY